MSKTARNTTDTTIDTIKEVYDFMCKEGLVSLDMERADYKISLKRRDKRKELQSVIVTHSLSPKVANEKNTVQEDQNNFVAIKSPLIGVFYRAPSPNRKPFVEVEQVVDKGQTLCVIEAMKVMNEIVAPSRCRIEKILVENGRPVVADQTIFLVSPVK